MRRGVGVGAIRDKKAAQDKFREKKNLIQENLVEDLSKQLEQFRTKLEAFAAKHRNAIKKDPAFREHFQEMCATIGVDPLASSKGFWSELLGMGSFYYEIAVQAVEVVLATSHLNGGIMTLGELRRRLNKSRSKSIKHSEVSSTDILRAIKSLNVLGKSCGVISTKTDKTEEYLIFCVPEELSLDNTTIVQFAANSGSPFVTLSMIEQKLGWNTQRVQTVLVTLVREGIVWVDDQRSAELSYWFPSLFLAAHLGKTSSDMEAE